MIVHPFTRSRDNLTNKQRAKRDRHFAMVRAWMALTPEERNLIATGKTTLRQLRKAKANAAAIEQEAA